MNIEPSSFCTICTKTCKQELVGFLLSLSIHHNNAKVYIICDDETLNDIERLKPYLLLNLYTYNELDEYTAYNRQEMEKLNIFGKFLSFKMKVMKYALECNNDTMFIDSDTIILDKLYYTSGFELGLSPQFITDKYVIESGYYNAGLIWTNNIAVCDFWETIIDHEHSCAEQINMIQLRRFNYFDFKDNYNLQTWRFLLSNEPAEKIASYLSIRDDKIYYKDERLKFIHTHFNSKRFERINQFFIQLMKQARLWKELAVVYRVINDKWVLTIPKQPKQGLFFHKNDSYRELPLLFKLNNDDVDVKYVDNTGHCWLEPNILLYDRPTLEWVNQECKNASLILLGNGDINKEGTALKTICRNVEPWIFWPRRPMLVEKILKKSGVLGWDERTTESIFIGNFENSVQQTYRDTTENWQDVLSEYHCTAGREHKFTNEEYLMKLRSSKYGLCLRGYGSKCHREVELMAFGTVPIVTSEVSIESYYDKPIENVHYIRVSSASELNEKISVIPKNKWENMSLSCFEWYQRNVYSKNAWNNMLSNILYNDKPIVCCFGASITQQSHGYVKELRNMIHTHKVEQHGYGGMHLDDAGIFFIDKALKNNPQILIVDWLSTGYNNLDIQTTLCIENIIYKCHEVNCIPIFIIPYRKDNIDRQDFYTFVVNTIEKYECGYISFEDILTNDDLKDVVHPNNIGSKKYADELYNRINNINQTTYKYAMPIKNKYYNITKHILTDKTCSVLGNTTTIDISGEIIGIVNKIGPYSPIVEIYDGSTLIKEVSIWDKHCSYERTHVNFKNLIINNNLTIKVIDDTPNYHECNNKSIKFNNYTRRLNLEEVYYIQS